MRGKIDLYKFRKTLTTLNQGEASKIPAEIMLIALFYEWLCICFPMHCFKKPIPGGYAGRYNKEKPIIIIALA